MCYILLFVFFCTFESGQI